MLRSGFILGVSAPAAILTCLVHPMVQGAADRWAAPVTVSAPAAAPVSTVALPGMRPVSLAISPTRVAGVPRAEGRSSPLATQTPEPEERTMMKQPRRTVREGCETALSALVGPEARRMTPGRCIS